MRLSTKPLLRCGSCLHICDPTSKGKEWVEAEKFREENGDDYRVVFAVYEEVYCPDCKELFSTDEVFHSDDSDHDDEPASA